LIGARKHDIEPGKREKEGSGIRKREREQVVFDRGNLKHYYLTSFLFVFSLSLSLSIYSTSSTHEHT
jgi:hypothetical protein